MRIIMLGAPGSGKGTQAEYIIKELQIPKISTGDMLRAAVAAGSVLGRQVKAIMESGALVSDDIILALIKERITLPDCLPGFLFDGFPRTIVQAESLWQAGIDVDYIVEIDVSDRDIIQRLTGRLVHLRSGRLYHTTFNPPKVAGLDDDTGEVLTRRADDSDEVVIERLKVYHEQTEPLTAWYQSNNYSGKAKYMRFSGTKGVQNIAQDILKFITAG